MAPIIQAENLTKIYRVGKVDVPALRSVSFSVERGEFVSARLESLRAFFALLDTSLAAFTQGKPFSADEFKKVIPLASVRQRGRH